MAQIEMDRNETSLAETAYRRIEEMIVLRDLAPGTMISEARLGEELGTGRTPIREALLRLKFEGYIEVYPSRGAMVSTIDVTKQLELLEVRRPLDETVARLASRRASDAERKEMLRLGDALAAAASARHKVDYLIANKAIHEIKVAATRNSMLEATLVRVNGLSRRFWYSYVIDFDRFSEAATLHGQILRSIAGGFADEAVRQSFELLDFLEGLTRRAMERDP